MSFNDRLMLFKRETARGVDAVPTALANAIQTIDFQYTDISTGTPYERNLDSARGGLSSALNTEIHRGASFGFELFGSGAAGTAPITSDLLRAVGFSEAVVAATSVTYDLTSEVVDSATIWGYHDGVQGKLTAFVGTGNISFVQNQFPKINVTGIGNYSALAEVAIPAPTFTGWTLPKKIDKANTIVTVDGIPIICDEISVEMQRPLIYRDVPGYAGGRALDRAPQVRIVLDRPPLATWNVAADIANSAQRELKIVHGTVAGQIVELVIKMQPLGEPAKSEQNTITKYTVTGRAVAQGNTFDARLIIR
jgi:hypothetical protein